MQYQNVNSFRICFTNNRYVLLCSEKKREKNGMQETVLTSRTVLTVLIRFWVQAPADLQSVFFYVHWAAVWFCKWMSTLGTDKASLRHGPSGAVSAATLSETPFDRHHIALGIRHCGSWGVTVMSATPWNPSHTEDTERLCRLCGPESNTKNTRS